ncbi:MAG: FtsX-like permease family protein [Bryobacteraceae bacterium]
MRTSTLLARSLLWYWRTNLAVVLGVAAAVAVLGGAAVVGASVRGSLRDLVLARLGNAETAITRAGFFREELAGGRGCPLIALEGIATHEPSGRRAAGIPVYAVDERFWKFQGFPGTPPRGREVLLTAALAREFGARPGDALLLRVPKPSAIPRESLHGRKEDTGRTLRLEAAGTARDFSLHPQQGELRAAYVSLARIQTDLELKGKANTILASGALKPDVTLADLGLRLREGFVLESDSTVVSDAVAGAAARAAAKLGLTARPVLSHLANTIRAGARQVPYSVVAALDGPLAPAAEDGIVLNEWAARELGARPGDAVTLDYYVWRSGGRLETESAAFRLERVVPLSGDAAGRTLTPEYPGITDSLTLREWDPPFPFDFHRIRPADERYWDLHRATPRAFLRFERGRRLWATRYGSATSIRISPPSPAYAEALRAALDPAAAGLVTVPVKALGLEAARGATEFGEYFLYFSFFLMASAFLLAGLFFRLGVEQRVREIGVLRALGFPAAKLRRLFLAEGAILSAAGSLLGTGAAIGYGALILLGLRTWWFDAVGTRLLSLHASWPALAGAALAGVAASLAAIAWTLRGLDPASPRGLIAGAPRVRNIRRRFRAGVAFAALAAALTAAGLGEALDAAASFFGAGTLLLIAALLCQSAWLHRGGFGMPHSPGALGLRGIAYRPGRSIVSIALIASATFVIASLDAFRREPSAAGAYGYPLLADSVFPLIQDPGPNIVPFRVRPGDDASCLNLFRPRDPRIAAPPPAFVRGTPGPWALLDSDPAPGVVPAIADANSMTYVLHRKLGEDFEIGGVRFRIVAALRDSIFQSELLISERNFLRLYPDAEGYRFFLIQAPEGAAGALEEKFSEYGFDVQPTAARRAGFHRVENTYLSTFRALGGLGLILGTLGLAAVLLRNVLERRRELALLHAVGYRTRHLAVMILAENTALLALGLATGALSAAVAIAPALAARGGRVPLVSTAALMAAVFAAGVVTSLAATAAALRGGLVDALKSE